MYNKTNKKFNKENIDFIISLIKNENNKEQCANLFFKKFNKSIGRNTIYNIAKINKLKIKNGRIITYEEIKKRLDRFNLKLIGKYTGVGDQIEVLCFCGKIFKIKANTIFMNSNKSCGCIKKIKTLKTLMETLKKLNIKLLTNQKTLEHVNYKTSVKLQCKYGHKFSGIVGKIIAGDKKCFECFCRRKFYGEISGMMWKTIKANAKRRGIKLNITRDQIWKLFLKQNRKCSLSGMNLKFAKIGESRRETTASLDRIDSSKDYNINNVQWIYKPINALKMDMKQKDFIKLCKMIAKYNKGGK